jgi:predicted lipoprotein with Yx(FWY)xxD motif
MNQKGDRSMKRLFQMSGQKGKIGRSILSLGVASAVLVIAGCGGGGSKSSVKTSLPAGKPAATSATLALGKTDLGKVLVGSGGRTLYLFEKDKSPMSTCSGACAAAWPPFTAGGKPKAAPGVEAAKLSTTKRADGKQQVVYAGHPLYYYAGDGKSGDTNGQDLNQFGASWYVSRAPARRSRRAAPRTRTAPSRDQGRMMAAIGRRRRSSRVGPDQSKAKCLLARPGPA